MDLNIVIELAILAVVIIQFIVIIILLAKNRQGLQKLIEYDDQLDKNKSGIESSLRDEFGRNRGELSQSLKTVSEQLSTTITNFTGLVDNKIQSILNSLTTSSKSNRDELNKTIITFEEKVTRILNTELKSVQDGVNHSTKESREELAASLKQFEEKSSAKIEALTKDTREGLEKNRETVERKLAEIQTGNEAKLDKMRETVDEKLQKTLEARLSASFKQVSDDLEKVQKGLGAMQNLASDVGDLKKVMSNVKTKGVLGEYQLEAILEQMLHPSQYEKNVKTKVGSDKHVEFAIKIPSKEDSDKNVWLPIDAKLPTSNYEILMEAYNNGDKEAVENARKAFSKTVKNFAKEIKEKYIDSPNTTDFAIMFLPFEGAYAEVVRDPELFEGIQREHKIIVTGPSTIAAFLNALQVGFRSLAVEKGTSVILNTLSAVKKEFGNFENILVKVKDQIDKASATLDETVGKRTKAINKALKKVETLSDDTVGQKLLVDVSSDLEETE
ncbi:MAG: DNA recombination protein RmuC [Spirochaetaceae bacterium]|jgi:DNA recombination protein RmuC|nr:DNA recombination protein RmuC [Spirochaetaceae bacterium]